MDTILYNSGYFEFRKYTRKEKRDYEKAGTILSNVVGNVVYSMWIPTTYFGNFVQNQNTNYELEKATLSGDWSSSHVPGFKPEFLLDRIEVKTTKIGNDKQEWVYNYGRRTVNTETIEHTLIVERE
jgi:hypothetical protein